MCQVAGATHALHEHGILHRDIKPGNIQVTAGGTEAVLMDLGLAQLANETDESKTRSRKFEGTIRYSSPEQLLGMNAERKSDIYSLGVTLWEMLTLKPLLEIDSNTSIDRVIESVQTLHVFRLEQALKLLGANEYVKRPGFYVDHRSGSNAHFRPNARTA